MSEVVGKKMLGSQVDMLSGSPVKSIVMFSIPLLIGNAFQQVYNIIDSIVVGHYLGTVALGAVGNAFPIIFMMVGMFLGLGIGANILIAQFFGAGDIEKVHQTTGTIYIATFVGSIVMTILGLVLNEPILNLMRVNEEMMPMAKDFMAITFLGVFPIFGYNIISSVLRGVGDSKTPVFFLVLSLIANTVFILLFVPVFHWGIKGAAWATVLAQALAFVLSAYYLHRKNSIFKISLENLQFNWKILKKVTALGVPAGLQQVLVAVGLMAVQGMVNNFETYVTAGYTGAMRIDSFAFMPIMTIGVAVSTYIAQNLGAGKMDRVNEGCKAGVKICWVVSIITSLLIVFLGKPLMGLFDKDPLVIEAGMQYLTTVVPFYVVLGLMFVFTGVMRGAGSVWVPLLATLFSMWLIRVPAAAILVHIMQSPLGIWWGFVLGWASGMIFAYVPYKRGKWREKKLIEEFN